MDDIKRLDLKIEKIRSEKQERRMLIGIMAVMTVVFMLAIIGIKHESEARMDKLLEEAYAAETNNVEEVTGPIYILNDEERDMVERVVAAEARGEDIVGQMAVAQVIRDRCFEWNRTPEQILTAENQFAEPYVGTVNDVTKAAVSFVFGSGQCVMEYPVTHFYAYRIIDEPEWAANMECAGDIGSHRFYREAE